MKSAAELMDRVSFLRAMDNLAATWRSKRVTVVDKKMALEEFLALVDEQAKIEPGVVTARYKENPVVAPPVVAPKAGGPQIFNTPEEAGLDFDPFHDPLEPVAEPVQPTAAEIVAAQTAELATRLEGKSGSVSVWMNDDFMAGEADKMAAALGWSMTAPPEPCAATARLHGGPSSGWRIKLHR